MTRDMQSYTSMKDFGVPWLGAVPAHWKVLPNRALFEEVREREHPEELMLSVTITKGVIPQQALLANTFKKDSSNQDKSAYKLVRPGDVVYNKMRAWQGAVGVSQYKGIVSPAYVIQRPRPAVLPGYVHYLLRTPRFAKEAERWSYGITSDQWSLRPEHFKMIYSCVPPSAEQAAIVQFLDHADRRIRRAIRAKQKLIKLLEEQKQAIIHRAVTRGLDSDVRLKPSGVEWLGDVPAHWEVTHLGRLVSLTVGFPFKSEGFSRAEGDIRLLRGINVATGYLRWDDVVRWPAEDSANFQDYELAQGDIVLGLDRPIVQNGVRLAVVTKADVPSLLLQRVVRIRASNHLNTDFAVLLLSGKSFVDYLTPIFTGISVPHLSPKQLMRFQVALPTMVEQQRIVDELAKVIRACRLAANRAEREIALLRDYNARLIADVVTGKLDVREAAAQLAEGDEQAALPDAEAPAEEMDDNSEDELDPVMDEVEA